MFDQKAPEHLRLVQEWFGEIITQPLVNEYIATTAPSGLSIQEEACLNIVPSPTLKPHERIQIYNQQYWWRLLGVLQDSYPCLTRLFGQNDFNTAIGVPYLLKHRPDSWSLNELGDKLPAWIQDTYINDDAALVSAAATVDAAFHALFYIPLKAPLSPEQIESKLLLQPHVKLFAYPFDIFTFRQELLLQPINYWVEAPFPNLKKGPFYTLLFRTLKGNTAWKSIQKSEYCLLQNFQKGCTLDAACTWLEEQPDEIRTQAEENLEKWFHEWSSKGLLTHESSLYSP